MGVSIEKQQRMYDTLKKIAREYESAERLLRNGERDYGVPSSEVLEMAYENIQAEAKAAIRGVRRPMSRAQRKAPRIPIPTANGEAA